MKPCRVWVIYDGKAGHLSQSLGLAEYLAEIWPIKIEVVLAKPKVNLYRKLALKLCRMIAGSSQIMARQWLARWVESLYHADYPAGKPDLVISFGGKILPLSVALATRFGCRNLAIGNRYGLPNKLFTAMVGARPETPRHHIDTPLPFIRQIQPPQDQEEQAKLQRLQALPQPLWLLLLGGDGSGYEYTSEHWQKLCRQLTVVAKKNGIRWLISSSRRTPVQVESLLTDGSLSDVAEAIICFHSQGADVRTLMLAAKRIFVTEDSLSMITEAVSCNLPVVTVFSHEPETDQGVHQQTLQAYRRLRMTERVAVQQLAEFQPTLNAPIQSYREFMRGVAEKIVQLPELDAMFSDLPVKQAPLYRPVLPQVTVNSGIGS